MDLICSNKTFVFDTVSKSLYEIATKGIIPNPRQGHCVVKYGMEMIIIGGVNENAY